MLVIEEIPPIAVSPSPDSLKHRRRIMVKTIILSVPPAMLSLFARRSIEEIFSFN